ncbi:pentapeptide repeat-containing protein [Legionella feeleii]|uniref:Serine/threonine-protein kinase B n=1 Tax=Legionella feeleii TaxID=453 RepID=A0A0W0TH52_9GAMM|nr:pentapeptide repeat-containing protein [Legionella feeleii]KTC94914.1 Serine/threonine-protein kinase B [Legionella feeleii]SPX59814.1 Serine/threonine-protein kinase B [Legionella feeleii]SPX59838.1 Serine/threonine-protein kinase B [Legionella feeleii]
MKIILLTSLIIISPLTLAKSYYEPHHIQVFKEKGVCDGCDLSGFDLTTNKNGPIVLKNSNLIRSNFYSPGNRQYSDFSNVMGLRFSMYDGEFSYSNFTNADLRNANLRYNNFTSADFTGANLTGADFYRVNLYHAKISSEQLKSVENICGAILPDGTEKDC